MDYDSEHKVDDSDDGWVLDSEYTGVLESEVGSESDGNTAVLTVEMWGFLSGFSCSTQTLFLLAPIITWARGSDSLRIISHEKG